MKPVATKDLLTSEKTDDFSQTVQKVQAEGKTVVAKTFTLQQSHIDQINAVAASLTARQSKPVNASEALRHILDRMREIGA